MNAAELIKELIKLGVVVKDAVGKSTTSGQIDWPLLIKTLAAEKDFETTLLGLVEILSSDSAAQAIGEIDSKQVAILKGRSVAQLPHDELLQYADLAEARLLLATHQLTEALNQNMVKWLVNDALPTLARIAPVVIPLLL